MHEVGKIVEIWDRFQIPLYILALSIGAVVGLQFPSAASVFEAGINPTLMALLYATFLGIPLTRIQEGLQDLKFLALLLAVNFLAVPLVAFVLSRFIAADEALLMGFLLVILAPCVDYVIVFSGLAGAAHSKLLTATPILMLAQMVLIPIFLTLFIGPETLGAITLGPFFEAFLLLIIIPLISAAITQWIAGKWQVGRGITSASESLMVPLMMLTLFLVVASQIATLRGQYFHIMQVIPLYAAFLLIMLPIGIGVSRLGGLGVGETRALVFSGATRNSLVVLPLALSLPPGFEVVPVVIVTQTLVELIGMVIYVRFIPLTIQEPRPIGNSQE